MVRKGGGWKREAEEKMEKKPAGVGEKGGGDTWRPELVEAMDPVLVPNKARNFKATDPGDRVFQLHLSGKGVGNSLKCSEESQKGMHGPGKDTSSPGELWGEGGFPVLWGEGSQGPWWAEIKGSLTETEEQRVHAHAIDAEEAVCDQVGANDHCLFRRKHLVPAWFR